LAPTKQKQQHIITTNTIRTEEARIMSTASLSFSTVSKSSSSSGAVYNMDAPNNNNDDDDDENQNKKRVPVTIRYSTESGMKPYYLTVAKRLKDLYPDVIIQPIEVQSFDGFKTKSGSSGNGNGSSTRSVGGDGGEIKNDENMASTIFEVIIDGKTVIRKTIRANTQDNSGSIFVKMSEIDVAVTRARKRRRPSTTTTVYSEATITDNNDGTTSTTVINLQDEDRLMVKQRLDKLKNKSSELQQLKKKEMKNFNNGGNNSNSSDGTMGNIGFE